MLCHQMLVASALVAAAVSSDPTPPNHRPTPTRPAGRIVERGAQATHAANLASFAFDVVRGQANVTVVGDSINNFGQSNWMYSGYLLEWRPHRWRQIHLSPITSSISAGAWVAVQPVVEQVIVQPGRILPGFEDFAGTAPVTIRIAQGMGWTGRAIAAGFHRDSFTFGDGVLRDADESLRLLRSEHTERHRIMAVTAATGDCRSRWTVRSRNSTSGTAMQTEHADVDFGTFQTPTLVWFDDVLPGSTGGLGHVASELLTGSDGPLNGKERCGFTGTILTDLDVDHGLGLTYIGQGGWRAENHAYPFGDPEVPVINPPNPYAGSYSDDALRRHVLAHESSHFMIWIGTNNGGIDWNAPERTADTIQAITDRFRRVHAEARLENPNLAEPRFLIVSPYCTSDACAYFRNLADLLRDLAEDDVAFIDLRALVEERFGDWSAWEETLLVDGVHPTLEGSRTFAKLLWRELVAAAGPITDLDRDGEVNGSDFGLFLKHWGSTDPLDLADFDGDGIVQGEDLGRLFLEWTSN
ncbi:MAG: GDSL-like Lipase/Acylhydrolase family [Planctomycetota bacterium]|jgi:hypothetical protein